ncbi:hypothetical protein BYT27DRAFT_7263631 [Phlegmacium glaucopus]|nr:hypothetical protein BYT27DRAFT_7263631 [Phlegmacium glaucopus]
MAGAELKELRRNCLKRETKRSAQGCSHGCETRRRKRVKNIVNGYPICNNEFATVEKLEESSIAPYHKTLIQLANADFEIE